MILRQLWSKTNLVFSRSSTIFALATGQQVRSGVAIIRVSGPLASQSLLKLTRETSIENYEPKKFYLRKLYHYQTNDLIDQCMTVWFKGRITWFSSIRKSYIFLLLLGPKSFTGEDVVEL